MTTFYGTAVSEGVGIGVSYVISDNAYSEYEDFGYDNAYAGGFSGADTDIENIAIQTERYLNAVKVFKESTENIAKTMKNDSADILLSHNMIVDDEGLKSLVTELLESGRYSMCEDAVGAALEKYKKLFLNSGDELLSLRTADIDDIKRRMLEILTDKKTADFTKIPKNSVLVIKELFPSMVADICKTADGAHGVAAVITERGGRNSHAGILARSMGIPMISGIENATDLIKNGDAVIVDSLGGTDGVVFKNPDYSLIKEYENKLKLIDENNKELLKYKDKNAFTEDEERIYIYANISKSDDIKDALFYGAEGVGLFRTENMFMECSGMPDEKIQYAEYLNAAKAFENCGGPVIIRTLDIGGDKQIPYLKNDENTSNSFLGNRAIRFCLDNEDIFKTQLKALIRAQSECGNIRVLIPFVTRVDEIKRTRLIIDKIKEELAAETENKSKSNGKENNENEEKVKIETGVMIETPAAVFMVGELGRYVDFFSIGTNDLTQYIMAADRTNVKTSHICSYYQPAVLKAVAMTVSETEKAGLRIEICGEAAADEGFITFLIGLGLRHFSVSPALILKIKKAVSGCNCKKASEIAKKALLCETEEEVKRVLKQI